MKKIISGMLVLILALSLLAGCGKPSGTNKLTVRLGGLKGATTIGMVKLLEDAEQGVTQNEYAFTMAASADELTPKFLQGEIDILALPANLGAVLYNKSQGAVQMLAVNALGVVYIVEKDGETVQSLADLKGKTVYATGKGSTPEYVLRYLLLQNGLDMDKDVNVKWKSEPAEIIALMSTQEGGVAMLPQPFVTVADTQLENLRAALDLTAEWDALHNGSKLITAGLLVRKEFAEQHPAEVTQFLKEYAASAEYVNQNPAEASVWVEKRGIVKAKIAEKAIPYCNIVCLTDKEMKKAAEGYFSVLFAQKPESVGGKMPGEDFYYDSGKEK